MIPSPGFAPAPDLVAVQGDAGVELARRLPDTPYSAISIGGLRWKVDRAFTSGPPNDPSAVVVQHARWPEEPDVIAWDPAAAWALLRRIPGWSYVSVAPEQAAFFAERIESELGVPTTRFDDLHYVLERAPVPHADPAVRRLGSEDIPLLEAAPRDVQGAGYRTFRELVSEGAAAGGVVDGRLVSLATVSAQTDRYADIGIDTLEAYRRRGFAAAGAYLMATEARARGLTPVWSTGDYNRPSQRVAEKLGFRPYGRRTFIVVEALRARGGHRPA